MTSLLRWWWFCNTPGFKAAINGNSIGGSKWAESQRGELSTSFSVPALAVEREREVAVLLENVRRLFCYYIEGRRRKYLSTEMCNERDGK